MQGFPPLGGKLSSEARLMRGNASYYPFLKAPHPSFATQNPPFSLRLGHNSALTVHWTVIHYRIAASLPPRGGRQSRAFSNIPLNNNLTAKQGF